MMMLGRRCAKDLETEDTARLTRKSSSSEEAVSASATVILSLRDGKKEKERSKRLIFLFDEASLSQHGDANAMGIERR